MLAVTVDRLIDDLNATIPHRCPTRDQSERDIFFYSGMRAVVDRLLILREMRDADDMAAALKTNVHPPDTENPNTSGDTGSPASATDTAGEPDTRIAHLGGFDPQ